jgi:hypothetical protein
VDLNPKAEIGPTALQEIVLAGEIGTVFCERWQKS